MRSIIVFTYKNKWGLESTVTPNINNQEWDFDSQREGWKLEFHSLDYPNYPHYIFNFPKYHHSNKKKLKK